MVALASGEETTKKILEFQVGIEPTTSYRNSWWTRSLDWVLLHTKCPASTAAWKSDFPAMTVCEIMKLTVSNPQCWWNTQCEEELSQAIQLTRSSWSFMVSASNLELWSPFRSFFNMLPMQRLTILAQKWLRLSRRDLSLVPLHPLATTIS